MRFYLVVIGHCNNPEFIDVELATPDRDEAAEKLAEIQEHMNTADRNSEERHYWSHNASYVTLRTIEM